jgi:predicted lactoylglutathione lyase
MEEKAVPSTEQLVIEIFVRDVEISKKFYRNLGFHILREDGG